VDRTLEKDVTSLCPGLKREQGVLLRVDGRRAHKSGGKKKIRLIGAWGMPDTAKWQEGVSSEKNGDLKGFST